MQRIKMLLFELGIPRDLSLIDLSQEYRHFLCFFLTFSFAYIPLWDRYEQAERLGGLCSRINERSESRHTLRWRADAHSLNRNDFLERQTERSYGY